MEWEVWLTGDRHLTSQDCDWDAVPDGILVVRYWGGSTGNGINWDDGLYGRPDTLKEAGLTDDVTFARVQATAQASRVPPSER